MRTMLFFLAFFLLLGASALQAQPGDRNMSPEQRAEQQTALMTEKLSLSEAQSAKVKEIYLKYAQKMREARENADGDWEAMRAVTSAIRAEQDKELQGVLTDEQWQQWTKYRDEMRANRGNWNREGAPGGDKPAPPPPPGNPDQAPKKEKNKR